MNDFTERYKNYSNFQLLKIIENAGSYEPAAVEAAKNIFESRQLSPEEITNAKNALKQEQQEIIAQQQKKKAITAKLKNYGTSVVDTLDPVQKTSPTAKKLITITSIAFALYFFYRVFREFDFLALMFSHSMTDWDSSDIIYLLPLFLLPLATILFYARKKAGWILLAICISHALTMTAFNTWMTLTFKPSSIPALDIFAPRLSPVAIITTALFFGSSLWIICKKEVREIYAMRQGEIFAATGITVIATIVMLY